MVRIKRSYRIQVCGAKMRLNGKLPSNHYSDRRRQTLELEESPSPIHRPSACSGIKACPGEGRGRCETQATLGGKPPSYASVSVP
jgi:hypothetical protein